MEQLTADIIFLIISIIKIIRVISVIGTSLIIIINVIMWVVMDSDYHKETRVDTIKKIIVIGICMYLLLTFLISVYDIFPIVNKIVAVKFSLF